MNTRIQQSQSKTNYFALFLALFAWLDMKPYFVWSQYNRILYTFNTYLTVIATILLFIKFMNYSVTIHTPTPVKEKNTVSLSLVFSSMLIVLMFLYQAGFSGRVSGTMQPFNAFMFCKYFGIMLFCLCDNYTLKSAFGIMKKIFALSLIPAIFIFVLKQLGMDIPYSVIRADAGKELTGQSYHLYYGVCTMLSNFGGLLNRLCGVYNEPGFVGTVGALLLVADKMNLKKWDNIVIFTALLFTFSLAFVLLLSVAFLMYKLYQLKDSRRSFGAIVMILFFIAAYFIFMEIPFSDGSDLQELQSRMEITEDGLAGDNRIASSEAAVREYDRFLESGSRNVLFGHGKSTIKEYGVDIWQDVCSYKEFIYYFGFIGMFFMVAFFICVVNTKYKRVKGENKWNIIVLLTVFIVSIYQRYSVTHFYYLMALLGGCANFALGECTETEGEKEKKNAF